MKFRKRRLEGDLKPTMVEIFKQGKYQWVRKLVLIDKNGSWLCTKYWNLNQTKEAYQELSDLGWEPA